MVRWVALAIAVLFKPKAFLVAENLCLRQQLLVLQRRHPRPRLPDADRRFWILACRWSSDWQKSLLVVKPETVLGWHRRGLALLSALALSAPTEGRAAADFVRAQSAHRTHGLGEPLLRSAEIAGRTRQAGI